MTDVYNQFLDKMDEAGDEFDSGGSSIGTVGRMKIEFGLHHYSENYSSEYWKFWRPYKSPQETQSAYSSAKEAMELAGEDVKMLQNGLKVTVFSEGILAGNAKVDLSKFCAKWKDAGKLILESARKEQLPINDIFYGQVKYTSDPYFVSLGEDGKTKEYDGKKMFPTFMLPVQKFANKQEAAAFVESNQPEPMAFVDSNTYSDKAMTQFTARRLEMCAVDIFEDVRSAYSGAPNEMAKEVDLPIKPETSNPRVMRLYEDEILVYVANVWGIEGEDINKLYPRDNDMTVFGQEIPF